MVLFLMKTFNSPVHKLFYDLMIIHKEESMRNIWSSLYCNMLHPVHCVHRVHRGIREIRVCHDWIDSIKTRKRSKDDDLYNIVRWFDQAIYGSEDANDLIRWISRQKIIWEEKKCQKKKKKKNSILWDVKSPCLEDGNFRQTGFMYTRSWILKRKNRRNEEEE